MASPYRFLAYSVLPLLRSRIWTVRGLENIPPNGGFILAANHQSWIDSGLLAAAVYRRLHKPLKFVSQSTKYGAVGGLPIDPNNRSEVLEVAIEALNHGFPVVIFPEGNSNNNPELRVGKTGVARLALRTGLPVLPVGIKGSRGVAAWRAFIWFWSFIYPCHVVIGQTLKFPMTELREGDTRLLQSTTDEILRHISQYSGKPMPGDGPMLGRHGLVWQFLWRLFRPLVQWRVRITGAAYLPETGPFVVVANHSSYFDAPALAAAIFHVTSLQPLFLTKATVVRAFRRFMGQAGVDALGYLPLDETDRSKILLPATNILKRGGVIAIFPEGTRNKPRLNPHWETELLKAKTGAARLYLATRVPMIPAGIFAPRGISFLQTFLSILKFWQPIVVKFGSPLVFRSVPAGPATKEQLVAMTQHIMNRIGDLRQMRYPY